MIAYTCVRLLFMSYSVSSALKLLFSLSSRTSTCHIIFHYVLFFLLVDIPSKLLFLYLSFLLSFPLYITFVVFIVLIIWFLKIRHILSTTCFVLFDQLSRHLSYHLFFFYMKRQLKFSIFISGCCSYTIPFYVIIFFKRLSLKIIRFITFTYCCSFRLYWSFLIYLFFHLCMSHYLQQLSYFPVDKDSVKTHFLPSPSSSFFVKFISSKVGILKKKN